MYIFQKRKDTINYRMEQSGLSFFEQIVGVNHQKDGINLITVDKRCMTAEFLLALFFFPKME